MGLSSTVGGISWSVGREQRDCRKERLAERLYARGQADAGDRLTCTIPYVRDALGPECVTILGLERAEAKLVASEVRLDSATQQQLADAEQRAKDAEQRFENLERVYKQGLSK